MVGLLDGKKVFEDMFSGVDRIPACDGQTDGQTDVLYSPRYAMCRAVKNARRNKTIHKSLQFEDLVALLYEAGITFMLIGLSRKSRTI